MDSNSNHFETMGSHFACWNRVIPGFLRCEMICVHPQHVPFFFCRRYRGRLWRGITISLYMASPEARAGVHPTPPLQKLPLGVAECATAQLARVREHLAGARGRESPSPSPGVGMNRLGSPFKGNHKGWFIGVILSFPTENQQGLSPTFICPVVPCGSAMVV